MSFFLFSQNDLFLVMQFCLTQFKYLVLTIHTGCCSISSCTTLCISIHFTNQTRKRQVVVLRWSRQIKPVLVPGPGLTVELLSVSHREFGFVVSLSLRLHRL